MWEALTDLVRSKAEYYRNKAKAIENPKSTPEGYAAWMTAVGTWAAVIAALIAACIFWQQLHTMQTQLKTDERHFVLDERPILAQDDTQIPPDVLAGPHYDKDSGMLWNYGIKNYGKTTAFNIVFYEYLSLNGGPFIGKGRPRKNSDTVPTQGFWGTAFYGLQIPPEEALQNRLTEGAIILKVIARYTDASGNPYELPLCRQMHANGTVGNCQFDQFPNISTTAPPPPAPKGTIH